MGLPLPEQVIFGKAIRLWKPLAELGHAGAQNNLGVMNQQGWGVPKDAAKAVSSYRKAVEQEYAPAHNNLGVMYNKGWGVLEDYVQAYAWWSIATARGY